MTPYPAKSDKEISIIVPADEGEDFSQSITLQMDERSVVELLQFDDTGATEAYMVVTLQQASNLHMALGQILTRHARSWGTKVLTHNLA